MFKILVATFAISIFAAAPSFASFRSLECSNFNGMIRYKYYQAWNTPVPTDEWTINGKPLGKGAITRESLAPETVLESHSTQMGQWQVISEKVRLTITTSDLPQKVEDWLLCRTGVGI